eukprot:TRINITY_DN18475_c0_g1_i1.p1 TRINITY_DN18475_c0_g1~~TRINITY_DN18475_c0_g1_i1.p1  ORF type:complete len:309 (+),score=38.23 TRINITY_DN18475_c0_g1_i1:58-984(+)
MAYQHSHHPQFVSPSFHNISMRGAYGDVMLELDYSIGRILDYLRDTGLDKDTLVMLASDNGPSLIRFGFGGSPGILRCGKGTTWEGGQRVAAIAWWPGKIKRGIVTDEMAVNIDIFPTILNLAGLPIPSDRIIDGKDLAPLLFAQQPVRDTFFYYGLKGAMLYAVRHKCYKVHYFTNGWGDSPKGLCGGDTDFTKQDPPLVFDVCNDIGETTPLPTGSAEYKDAVETAAMLVQAHNCNSTADACYNEFGPNHIWAQNKCAAPYGPKPFHSWIPKFPDQFNPDCTSNATLLPVHSDSPQDHILSEYAYL